MSHTSTRLMKYYKSRNVLLSQLETQGFEVNDYQNFSINEIDAMLNNKKMDMLLSKKDGSKAYVNYLLDSTLRPAVFNNLVYELFETEAALTDRTKDMIIIISQEEPNASVQSALEYMFNKDGYFIVVIPIARLQFNVLEHTLVPKCHILKEEDVAELMQRLNLNDLRKLPEISRFDPQALAMGIRPGQVVMFERKSPTALVTPYWRYCK